MSSNDVSRIIIGEHLHYLKISKDLLNKTGSVPNKKRTDKKDYNIRLRT